MLDTSGLGLQGASHVHKPVLAHLTDVMCFCRACRKLRTPFSTLASYRLWTLHWYTLGSQSGCSTSAALQVCWDNSSVSLHSKAAGAHDIFLQCLRCMSALGETSELGLTSHWP